MSAPTPPAGREDPHRGTPAGRGSPGAALEDDLVEDAAPVRPYAVSGGRRAPTAAELPLEALVRARPGGGHDAGAAPGGSGPGGVDGGPGTVEERRALELAASWVSVAELSAHLRLPVPVVRIVVDGLVSRRRLVLQTTAGAELDAPARPAPAGSPPPPRRQSPSRAVLESVLDGIRRL